MKFTVSFVALMRDKLMFCAPRAAYIMLDKVIRSLLMGRKLRQHKIMIYALAALWLLPYAALLFAAPKAPSGGLTALIIPDVTEKSAEVFGAATSGAAPATNTFCKQGMRTCAVGDDFATTLIGD